MKKNKDLVKAGLGLAIVGGVSNNSVISGVGSGLFALGVMSSALNTQKPCKFKRKKG